ncbi:hypothetical protein DUI87_13132 [Hirundo rustica rustica]|uniref:Uncharacterized protein n=1 Tax=Hirundo rustica rustica TaxID=333673 RepID=A0A3M0KH97_HIRRU|nr:hypothetical protein DUI87_13132 [Hirundo rustica rustica]
MALRGSLLYLTGDSNREAKDSGVGPKIPQALEKILQLKESHQEELVMVLGLLTKGKMETELQALPSTSEVEEDTGTSKKEWNWKHHNHKKKRGKEDFRGFQADGQGEGEGAKASGEYQGTPDKGT